jgi:hypothetical protein
MAYSLTSAASPKALLAEIVTFANAQGWTIEFDNANGASGSIGGQIGLSSGNCHVLIGEGSASQNPVAVSGALGAANDGRLFINLAFSITPANMNIWQHSGSILSSQTDSKRLTINDVWGPMDEVHFFGDADYILVAIKTAANRYTTFGFGNLDTKGMSADKCGFAFGHYQEFWDTTTTSIGGTVRRNCRLGAPNNMLGAQANYYTVLCFIPDGVLDTTLGFPSGDLMMSNVLQSNRSIQNVCYLINGPETSPTHNSDIAHILDHWHFIRPQATTGGMPLFAVPFIFADATALLTAWLGEVPGFRLCRITNYSAGESAIYGTDEWLVFPWKQKGTAANAGQDGGTYNNQPNSYDAGYALKYEP